MESTDTMANLLCYDGNSPERGTQALIDWLNDHDLDAHRVESFNVDVDTLAGYAVLYKHRDGKRYFNADNVVATKGVAFTAKTLPPTAEGHHPEDYQADPMDA